MTDSPLFAPLTTPIVRPLRWIGLALAVLIAALGASFGLAQSAPVQYVILTTVATFALALWLWNGFFISWAVEASLRGQAAAERSGRPLSPRAAVRGFAFRNKGVLVGLLILIFGFVILSLTLATFMTWLNLFTGLLLAASLVFTTIASRGFGDNRSAFIGLMVLGTIFVVASLHVQGFLSAPNVKSMLVFASFLGIATVGQTLVALLGGLDLSIPFVIGSSNVGLLYLIGLGIPSPIAVGLILVGGALIGLLNGVLSYPLQGQALIVTLGVG